MELNLNQSEPYSDINQLEEIQEDFPERIVIKLEPEDTYENKIKREKDPTITDGREEIDLECNIKLESEDITYEFEQVPEFVKVEELFIKNERDDSCNCCGVGGINSCSKYRMMAVIIDKPVPKGVNDRAATTIPDDILELRASPANSLGVHARICLSKGVQLGPYEGRLTKVEEGKKGYSWKLVKGRLEDTSNEKESNYLRYVNCAKDSARQNLVVFQYKGELYYRTCQNVRRGDELLIHFGDSVNDHVTPQEDDLSGKYYACEYCYIGLREREHRDEHRKLCTFWRSRTRPGTSVNSPSAHKRACRQKGNRDPLTKRYICGDCSYTTKRKRLLDCHRSVKHERKDEFRCPECDYVSYCEVYLKDHRRKHELKNAMKCTECEFETYYMSSMNEHKRKHERENVFKCADCEYQTYSKRYLIRHVQKHLRKDPELDAFAKNQLKALFKCTDCDFETYYKFNMLQHRQKHERINAFKCNECEFETYIKRYLVRHKKKHL